MSKLYLTEGLVLKTQDYRETDRLVTVFSPDYGRIPGIVKGVKKPKSKLRGVVQLFTHGKFQFYPGRTLHTLTQGQPYQTFTGLTYEYNKMTAGFYVLELLNKLIMDQEQNPELFGLSLASLHLLVDDYDVNLVIRIFEIKLLQNLGFTPHLQSCLNQHRLTDKIFIDPVGGGLICQDCARRRKGVIPIQKGTLSLLNKMIESPISKLKNIRISKSQNEELDDILTNFIFEQTGYTFKSKNYFTNIPDSDAPEQT